MARSTITSSCADELERAGHRFSTDHSDTEVIVHLYEDRGLDFLAELNGMFAIALWDARRRRLVLARDRLGIKPLYLARVPGGVAFGSEPKALLQHPAISRAPDFGAIHHYLSLKNVPAPLSAFRDIEQLRAGELAVCSDSSIERRRWWRVEFRQSADVDEHEAAGQIRALLQDSVRLQMRSDVPFGAYLSGGVDSSSVVALLAKLGAGRIKTFTLVYDDAFPNKENDRRFARLVAERYGTEHHEHLVTFNDLPEKLDQCRARLRRALLRRDLDLFHHPVHRPPREGRALRRRSRRDVCELSRAPHRFARSRLTRPAATTRRRWRHSRMTCPGLLHWSPAATRRPGAWASISSMTRRSTSFIPRACGLPSPACAPSRSSATRWRPAASPTRSTGRFSSTSRRLLPDQVLAFVDRLSMAHSVEVRPPFLDHRLVELVAGLPGSLKIKGGRVKHILKEAVADLLPAELLARPKEGFIMPVNEWLIGSLKDYVQATLAPERLARHGLFRPEAIRQLLASHYAGGADHGNRIWNLLMLQLWWERYID